MNKQAETTTFQFLEEIQEKFESSKTDDENASKIVSTRLVNFFENTATLQFSQQENHSDDSHLSNNTGSSLLTLTLHGVAKDKSVPTFAIKIYSPATISIQYKHLLVINNQAVMEQQAKELSERVIRSLQDVMREVSEKKTSEVQAGEETGRQEDNSAKSVEEKPDSAKSAEERPSSAGSRERPARRSRLRNRENES